MDDYGNIEPSQAPSQSQTATVFPDKECADIWGNAEDDQDYLQSLNAFEQTNSREISDELLLECLDDFDLP